MSIRIVSKKYLDTTTENMKLEVEIFYSRGGWNFATGKDDPRGYWLCVQPVRFIEEAGIKMISFALLSGFKKFLLQAKADRKGGTAEKSAVLLAEKYEQELVEQVCIKEKLTLTA